MLATSEERSPRSFSSPCYIFCPRQEPPKGSFAPNGSATACKWVLPPVEARNLQGTLSLPLISPRGESSSSTPFWVSRLEREKGSCPSLLEPMLREAEAMPMKDGSTEILNPDLEKDVAK